METWGHDKETLRPGDMDMEIRHGHMKTRRHGDKETWRHGHMETRHGRGDILQWHGEMELILLLLLGYVVPRNQNNHYHVLFGCRMYKMSTCTA